MSLPIENIENKIQNKPLQDEPRAALREQAPTFCSRSVIMSGLLTVSTTLLLLGVNQNAWAWGFLIGALLSVMSLLSFTVLVPFLFQPNAPRFMSALLGLTLMMKLPLFVAALYLLTHLHGVAPGAGVIGIALGPAVITLKTLGGLLPRTVRAKQPVLAIEQTNVLVTAAQPRPSRALAVELAPERA